MLLWILPAHTPAVSVVVFLSVPGTWSVRFVSDSCIHRLCPFTPNQRTVPHSVSWYGVICCCSRIVIIWHCNSPRQYPLLFDALCYMLPRRIEYLTLE